MALKKTSGRWPTYTKPLMNRGYAIPSIMVHTGPQPILHVVWMYGYIGVTLTGVLVMNHLNITVMTQMVQ